MDVDASNGTRSPRSARKLRIAALVVVAVSLIAASSAIAHHNLDNFFPTIYYAGGATNCSDSGSRSCQADNTNHEVYFEGSFGNGIKINAQNRLMVYDNHTDLHWYETATPTYSGAAETDVIVQNAVIPNLVGRVFCEDLDNAPTVKCDQHYMILDVQETIDEGFEKDDKKSLACHEFGHTIGLKHGSESEDFTNILPSGNGAPGDDLDPELRCMERPLVVGQGDRFIGTHNKTIINGNY